MSFRHRSTTALFCQFRSDADKGLALQGRCRPSALYAAMHGHPATEPRIAWGRTVEPARGRHGAGRDNPAPAERHQTYDSLNMKPRFRYPFLTATCLLGLSVSILYAAGRVNLAGALLLAALGDLLVLSFSKRRPALFIAPLSPELVQELDDVLRDLRVRLREPVQGLGTGVRWMKNVPFVTPDCAQAITALFVVQCANIGALHLACSDQRVRERVLAKAKRILDREERAAKAALTESEIPLPVSYIPQIIELVYAYGQARQYATVFPLPTGKAKLPRLKAGEDEFGYLGTGTAGGLSQPVPEKQVAAEPVEFDANKAGGIIRLPFELEEDTFIPLGQFLARYIARQFAKLEDKTLFLADGSPTYAGQTGVGPYCAANTDYLLQLAAGKTKPSDIALDDFRSLRGKVNPAIIADATHGAAYYLSPTFEPLLRSFNQYPNFVIFTNENGKPMFDGWPVRWVGVTQANNGTAAPGTFPVFFGALNYWYFGERGNPRLEVSKELFFQTDELALRALERIDIQNLAVDAMAAVQLPNA